MLMGDGRLAAIVFHVQGACVDCYLPILLTAHAERLDIPKDPRLGDPR